MEILKDPVLLKLKKDTKAISNFLLGQLMKKMPNANPVIARKLIIEELIK